MLAFEFPDDFPPMFARALADKEFVHMGDFPEFIADQAYKACAERWSNGGI